MYRTTTSAVRFALFLSLMIVPWCDSLAQGAQPKDVRALRTGAERIQLYARREGKAPDSSKKQLDDLRRQIRDKTFTFKVGYTTAADRKLSDLCGWRPQKALGQVAKQQNKIAMQKMQEMMAWTKQKGLKGVFQRYGSVDDARFNWAEHGKVTAVRDQGACGSCWAFAALGAFEGSTAIRFSGVHLDFSEQCLLECTDGDCRGGHPWMHAFPYIDEEGIPTEASYPYTAPRISSCRRMLKMHGAKTWGYVGTLQRLPDGYDGTQPSVTELKRALLEHGPLAAGVNVTTLFQHYTGGVFDEHHRGASVNHGVTLIGWDDTKGSAGAWQIKNSWGPDWGEDGFMWIEYGCNNIGRDAGWIEFNREMHSARIRIR